MARSVRDAKLEFRGPRENGQKARGKPHYRATGVWACISGTVGSKAARAARRWRGRGSPAHYVGGRALTLSERIGHRRRLLSDADGTNHPQFCCRPKTRLRALHWFRRAPTAVWHRRPADSSRRRSKCILYQVHLEADLGKSAVDSRSPRAGRIFFQWLGNIEVANIIIPRTCSANGMPPSGLIKALRAHITDQSPAEPRAAPRREFDGRAKKQKTTAESPARTESAGPFSKAALNHAFRDGK